MAVAEDMGVGPWELLERESKWFKQGLAVYNAKGKAKEYQYEESRRNAE